jgi:predicted TIM-barrel fold metal-dependent hydrolase
MIDGMEVIDFHSHVGRWDALGMHADPQTMLRAMDAAGIDRVCLFDIFYPDGTRANDLTAAFVAQHPDRFVGFAYVSPWMPERMVRELERAVDELGFLAIKLYPPYVPYEANDPVWDPVYRFADARELAIIVHTGSDAEPRYLAEAAGRFPKATFVAAHAGNSEPFRSQAIAGVKENANFYVETCSTFRTPGVIEELVEKAGADRVLYGSDMPLMDPRAQIGKIITADIGDEAKRLILGENARRLLKL